MCFEFCVRGTGFVRRAIGKAETDKDVVEKQLRGFIMAASTCSVESTQVNGCATNQSVMGGVKKLTYLGGGFARYVEPMT